MSEQKTQELDLEAFSIENLFADGNLSPDMDPLKPELTETKVEDKVEEKKEEEKKTEIVEDETKAPEGKSVDETTGKEKDEKEPTEVDSPEEYLPFYTALNEKLGIEGEPDKELLQKGLDGVLDYLKGLAENTIEAELEDIKSAGNGLVGELYEFLKNGGDPETFKETYFKQEDYTKIPVEGEANLANQRKVVEDLLKKMGDEAEDIKEKLSDYENAGILEKEAKTAQKKLVKLQEQDKANLLKQQEEARKNAEAQREQYWEGVKSTIMTSEELGGLPITKENKEKLVKHLTQRGKDGLTDYERNLRSDKNRALKFAYVDMLNFDFGSLERKAKTEVTKEVKKALSRFTDGGTKIVNKAKSQEEPLEDKRDKPDYTKFKLPIH